MPNNTQTQSPYISLDFCSCQQDFSQIPITRRDLGNTGTFINYSMVVVGTGSSELLSKYMDSQEVSKRVNTLYKYKLMGNFGIFSYLFKKVEGKDNERAIKEVVFETAATEIGGTAFRKVIASQTTKTLATKTASRLGITMAGRILGGYVGSVIPIAGTIIGAVVGAWLAGKVEEWWFSEEDKALAEDKAENERIAKLQSQYQDKINQITSYLTNNHYIELRELTELEAEMLCKNLSNLDMDSKSGIALMLSFPHYLKKESKQEVYTPLSPQGISFPYSSIIYLTTIKALKDTLKEYLPKAKKIVLYTPNPFVSLYTSSPFYVFNSNLSFFNPHLQYLLTSKDTQQWLYDTLFNLARDNREIIVYEWGGSIEELDFKESQANKKDLDSKDTNQSTNIQKQTKQLGKESNKELKENQKGLESKNFYSKIQSFLCYDSKKRYA